MSHETRIRVVNVHGPGDVRLDTAERPEVGKDDVLLRIHVCGICGTDVHYVKTGGGGRRKGPDPMPIGHEASGEIIAVGSAVSDYRPGERVIVNPMTSSAVIGNGGTEGAFSDILLVRDASKTQALLRLPPSLDYADAALAEPWAVSLRAVNRGKPRSGESAKRNDEISSGRTYPRGG